MTKSEVVNELQYYQMYIGEILSCYYFNEAICDLADSKPNIVFKYGLCLSTLSSALKYKSQTVASILLCRISRSKSIPKSIDRILCEKISDDLDAYKKIKTLLHDVNKLIEKNNDNILELRAYRDSVYAHFEQEIFDDKWQADFMKEHDLNFTKLKILCENIFDIFSKILEILDEEPFVKSLVNPSDISAFLDRIKGHN